MLGPMMRWGSGVLWYLLLLLAAGACAPKKPTLTPNSVQVTGVGVLGMTVRADVSVYNPNRYSLNVQTVSGRVVLNDVVPLGSATTASGAYLPSQRWQRVIVDLQLPWLNLPAALALAQVQQQVPYTFDGNATVGGRIRITVPFRMQGQIPARELLRASVASSATRFEIVHLGATTPALAGLATPIPRRTAGPVRASWGPPRRHWQSNSAILH